MWNNHGVRRLRASFLVGVGEEGLFFLHPPPPTLTDILTCFTCKELQRGVVTMQLEGNKTGTVDKCFLLSFV